LKRRKREREREMNYREETPGLPSRVEKKAVKIKYPFSGKKQQIATF
jgi:hypothetical protein